MNAARPIPFFRRVSSDDVGATRRPLFWQVAAVRLVDGDPCFKVDGVAIEVGIMVGNHFQAFVLGNFEFLQLGVR